MTLPLSAKAAPGRASAKTANKSTFLNILPPLLRMKYGPSSFGGKAAIPVDAGWRRGTSVIEHPKYQIVLQVTSWFHDTYRFQIRILVGGHALGNDGLRTAGSAIGGQARVANLVKQSAIADV